MAYAMATLAGCTEYVMVRSVVTLNAPASTSTIP
jgi:hypothetical protein